ncbi:MAG TPA: hypothetical protein PKG52_09660 [bacterium]|nr:hypothetical protein [bacterium]HPS30585.1 hypothetical protein [bacterium]
MKNSIKFLVVTIAFLSLIPLAAQGMGKEGSGKQEHGKMGHGGGMKGMMSEMMLEDAGVPETQRAEIRKKGHEIHKEMMDINYNIGELRLKMKSEFEKAKPDVTILKNFSGQIAELRKKQFNLIGNFKIEVMTSLTTDQRKKVMDTMKAKREKFMEKMGEEGPDMDD